VKTFNDAIMLIVAMKNVTPEIIGSVTPRKRCQALAPSSLAAS